MKEKNQKGIIQIPLLIGIIVISVIVTVIIVYRITPNLGPTTTTTELITTTTSLVSVTNWSCGDSVTFNYKGDVITYATVESQGRCWLDRNLGASQVATVFNDSQAYGDLFQWGRLDDGHQDRKSEITTILSNSDNPGHSNFIGVSVGNDWRVSKNNNLWQGVSGINNPCPSGWRLPTSAEWDTERLSWSSNNAAGAFASSLKLTVAGGRYYGDLPLFNSGFRGVYWSSTVGDYRSVFCLTFSESAVLPLEALEGWGNVDNAVMYESDRPQGYSVRCIKD